MMPANINIRYQKVSDAKRFVDILSHPDFIYFPVKPESIEEEKEFLRLNARKRKEGFEYNFSITSDEKVVGAIGVKIDQHRKYIGEIGYFVDREFWGKGIAPAAVKLAENFCFKKLKLERLEIATLKNNKASKRVAEKCGYHKEGVQKGKLLLNGKYCDGYIYSKTRSAL